MPELELKENVRKVLKDIYHRKITMLC